MSLVSPPPMSPTRVMSHLSRTPSLKEAEDGRLLARIERNFECLRRDGRAAGTLSGWGELLRTKFKHHKAETSDLAAAQSSTCAAWLCGSLTGRVAMVEFLQAEKLVRKSNDPTSVTSAFGLGDAILHTDWLYGHVFSRPPQAVIYETLLSCAEDALERKPEDLTAPQINLALRKLALNFLPRSGESARAEAKERHEAEAEAAMSEAKADGGGQPRAADAEAAAAAAPGDEYLRIQVAMELLKLHVNSEQPSPPSSPPLSSPPSKAPFSWSPGSGGSSESSGGSDGSPLGATKDRGGVGVGGLSPLEELAAAAAKAMSDQSQATNGDWCCDGDAIVRRELGLLATGGGSGAVGEGGVPGGGLGGWEGQRAKREAEEKAAAVEAAAAALMDKPEAMEALNKFLEAYVSDLSEVKARLASQVAWLEERGAYRLLGVGTDASEATLKKCYHRLSLKAHPDKGGDPEAFLRLKVAYETVLKKKRRAAAREAKLEAKAEARRAESEEAKRAARAQAKAEAEEAIEQRRVAAAAAAAAAPTSKENLRAKQMAKYGKGRGRAPAPSPKGVVRPLPRTSRPPNASSSSLFPSSSPASPQSVPADESGSSWEMNLSDGEDDLVADHLGVDDGDGSREEDVFGDGGVSSDGDADDDVGSDFFASDDEEGEEEGVEGSEKNWAREFIRTSQQQRAQRKGNSGDDDDDNGGNNDDDDDKVELDLDDTEDDDDDDDGLWPDGRHSVLRPGSCGRLSPSSQDGSQGGSQDGSVSPPHSPSRGLFGSLSSPASSTSSGGGKWRFDVGKKGPLLSDDEGDEGEGEVLVDDEDEEEEEVPLEEEKFEFRTDSPPPPPPPPACAWADGGGSASPSSPSAAFEDKETLIFSAKEHRLRLGELENKAKAAAKKAASLAHICIQWSKVVSEVRVLTRPRGVEHLGSLINKGAFSSAVDVMEPTQEAATCVMDIVQSSIEVTKESARTMALASNMGFFQVADRVTTEGRTALSAASSAAEVNAAAVKAMGRLSTLGELAREDDEVHTALVDMLCLHFQRVAESTQCCAKQALVAVTAASHVCSLLDALHDQAKLEAESAADDDEDEEEEGDELHPDDKRSKEEAEEAAREKADQERRKKSAGGGGDDGDGKENKGEGNQKSGRKKDGSKGCDGEDGGDDENGGAAVEGAVGETVDSLLGKLRELHAQMRKRHGANLRKMNGEVLALQYRLEECLRDTSLEKINNAPASSPRASHSTQPSPRSTPQQLSASSGAAPFSSFGTTTNGGGGGGGGGSGAVGTREEGKVTCASTDNTNSLGVGGGSNGGGGGGVGFACWRPLLCALADHVNSTCLRLEEECRAHLRLQSGQRASALSPPSLSLSSEKQKQPASLAVEWWGEALGRSTSWLETLAHRTEVAISCSGRGKVLRLASAVDPVGVRRMLSEMQGRLKALLNQLAMEGHASSGAPRHRAALDQRFLVLSAPLHAAANSGYPVARPQSKSQQAR